MGEQDRFDAIVIGAGSAGVRFARTAAGFGARIAIIESRQLGGTCVNVGCVPKKLLVYGSQLPHYLDAMAGYGWRVAEPDLDWPHLLSHKKRAIERLNGIYGKLLADSGVTLFEGNAQLLSPATVEVAGYTLTAKQIVIATGGWPKVPDIPGRDCFITSNEFFALAELPKQATILGGGYIAVEFAGILNGLGVETTLVYRGPLFLRGFDDDVRSELAQQMTQRGVRLLFNTNIDSIVNVGTVQRPDYDVHLSKGGQHKAQCVVACTGRGPNLKGLGIDALGIHLNQAGFIEVDQTFQTNVPSVYALGDVIGRVALTPVAIKEAMWLSRYLYGTDKQRVDQASFSYDYIPTAVFSQPELATVGYSEAQARTVFDEIEVYRSQFKSLKHSMTGKAEKHLMKMIVDKSSQRVVGLHLLGEGVGEIMQGFAVAIKMGATKAQFDDTVGIHPTSAEELVTLR